MTDPTLTKFTKSIDYSEGRYTVALPWKSDSPKLLNNERLAKSRLDNLTHRLKKDPELECRYNAVFSEMWEDGIIE